MTDKEKERKLVASLFKPREGVVIYSQEETAAESLNTWTIPVDDNPTNQLYTPLFNNGTSLSRTNSHHEASHEFLKAFITSQNSVPEWKLRFLSLQGYTGAIDKLTIKQLKDDGVLETLKMIEGDLDEAVWIRGQAMLTKSLVMWNLGDLEGACVEYLKLVDLVDGYFASQSIEHNGEKKVLWTPRSKPAGTAPIESPVDEVLKEFKVFSIQNLKFFSGPNSCVYREKVDDGYEPKPSNTYIPGSATPRDRALIQRALKLPAVLSLCCAACGKKREFDDKEKGNKDVNVAIRRCSRCQRVAYCSKECQTQHWNEGRHKRVCRGPKDFKRGDVVTLWGIGISEKVDGDDADSVIGQVSGRGGVSELGALIVEVLGKVEGGVNSGRSDGGSDVQWTVGFLGDDEHQVLTTVRPENMFLRIPLEER
ncbi:hypothetical protein HDU76_003042 [Blyttiomyces sp. JEL0837]|nr:hypothetical protein HDU76_003042 [Blyttiomyces sp. JEL0837]